MSQSDQSNDLEETNQGTPEPTGSDEAAETPEVDGDQQAAEFHQANAVEALAKIKEATLAARECEAEYELKKELASEAKKRFEKSQERLMVLVEQLTSDAPLFDQVDSAAGNGDQDDDDAWRFVPLEDALAELPPAIMKSFHEAEIVTMGQLADFTSQKRLIDIPGIGEAKAAKIDDALTSFWASRHAESDKS